MIKGTNLNHVTTHRWPPVSYEREMDKYCKKYRNESEKVGKIQSRKNMKPKDQKKKDLVERSI